MIDCKNYENCNAPICPLLNNQESEWFPDEEICSLKKYAKLPYIQLQKKIAKKTRDHNKYFIFDMLNRSCIIGKGMVGLDPDYEKEAQLRRWLIKHPSKKRIPLKITV